MSQRLRLNSRAPKCETRNIFGLILLSQRHECRQRQCGGSRARGNTAYRRQYSLHPSQNRATVGSARRRTRRVARGRWLARLLEPRTTLSRARSFQFPLSRDTGETKRPYQCRKRHHWIGRRFKSFHGKASKKSLSRKALSTCRFKSFQSFHPI